MLLCPPTNGRGVIPAQGVSVLLGIQLSARVANLLLAAFHANYAADDDADDSQDDDKDDDFDDHRVTLLPVTVVLVLPVGFLVTVIIVVISFCFYADPPRPPGGNCAALVPSCGALSVIGTDRQRAVRSRGGNRIRAF